MKAAAKAYELTFTERSNYLHVCIHAETIDRAMALDYFAEVASKCADVRCKRMLLERDIPAMIPDEDLFTTMNDFIEMSIGIRVAFVNAHTPIDDALKHIVDFGIDRGADFQYFKTVDEAERWLDEC